MTWKLWETLIFPEKVRPFSLPHSPHPKSYEFICSASFVWVFCPRGERGGGEEGGGIAFMSRTAKHSDILQPRKSVRKPLFLVWINLIPTWSEESILWLPWGQKLLRTRWIKHYFTDFEKSPEVVVAKLKSHQYASVAVVRQGHWPRFLGIKSTHPQYHLIL